MNRKLVVVSPPPFDGLWHRLERIPDPTAAHGLAFLLSDGWHETLAYFNPDEPREWHEAAASIREALFAYPWGVGWIGDTDGTLVFFQIRIQPGKPADGAAGNVVPFRAGPS